MLHSEIFDSLRGSHAHARGPRDHNLKIIAADATAIGFYRNTILITLSASLLIDHSSMFSSWNRFVHFTFRPRTAANSAKKKPASSAVAFNKINPPTSVGIRATNFNLYAISNAIIVRSIFRFFRRGRSESRGGIIIVVHVSSITFLFVSICLSYRCKENYDRFIFLFSCNDRVFIEIIFCNVLTIDIVRN